MISCIRHGVLSISLLSIWSMMLIKGAGEWYALTIYPRVSYCLSAFSSHFAFSLGDFLIFFLLTALAINTIITMFYTHEWKRFLKRWIEVILWIYCWFYVAWGLNYYRDDYYKRTDSEAVAYTKDRFEQFLTAYIDSLNSTYCDDTIPMPKDIIENEINSLYRTISFSGLNEVSNHVHAKNMLFRKFMNQTGIMGYINPFFAEYNLNPDLLQVQYPSTYAHELSHLLGISNEAEANYYAYKTCTSSSIQEVRFSGYFSILHYVLSNAYIIYSNEDYAFWRNQIRTEVIARYNDKAEYWRKRYNPMLGEVQNMIYNAYLKGNRISSGTKNYAEVIALILAAEDGGKCKKS